MMDETLIQFENVGVKLGVHTLFDQVFWEFKKGRHALLTGPSGSGKTTFLHLVGGLLAPTSGRILFKGTPYPALGNMNRIRRKHMGFLFQDFYLLEHLNVEDNVGMFQSMLGDRRTDLPTPSELLGPLGLGDRLKDRASILSRGERQRLAMARAFSHAPEIVIADEPTASLDPACAEDTMGLLWQLTETLGTTALVVTHDQHLAKDSNFDQRLVISGRKLESGRLEP